MTETKQIRGFSAERQLCQCTRCGGSGILRTDSSGYRTCLDCLGQGVTLRLAGACGVSQRRPLSASTSVAR